MGKITVTPHNAEDIEVAAILEGMLNSCEADVTESMLAILSGEWPIEDENNDVGAS